MKNRKLLLIVSLVLALTMSLGGTLAYLTDTDEAVNVMTLGNVDIEQHEKDAEGNPFVQSQPLYPAYVNGDTVVGAIDKVVTVENTGKSDAYVRTWIAFEVGTMAEARFAEVIHKDIATAGLTLSEGAYITIEDVKYYVVCATYNEALAAGRTTQPSLQKVYMDAQAKNEDVAHFGETYEILVYTQAVQTANMESLTPEQALNAAFGENHPWVNGVNELPTTVVRTAAELKEALEAGGTTVVLGADIDMGTEMITIAAGKTVRLDLAGHDLKTDLSGKGDVHTALITVKKGASLTINGNGNVHAVANQELDKVSAIINNDAGNVTINGGSYTMDYGTYAEGYLIPTIVDNNSNVGNATLTINGGTFTHDRNMFRNFANAASHNEFKTVAKIVINGGTFIADGDGSAAIWNQKPSSTTPAGAGEVVINGGTFAGVTVNDDWETIPADPSGDNVNTMAPANTADQLYAALDNGKDVLLTDDIVAPAANSNGYGSTGLNVDNGQTIDGNGQTLSVPGANTTWDSAISTTGGTIKNLTIDAGFRGIFINHNRTYSETVVLENVTIDGPTYTISCDQGTNQNLVATNCTINGWTSYAATIGEVKFENCNFGEGAGYAFCRPYAPTEFVGCNFAEGYKLDARAAVTFENCTIGGVALTADNLSTLVTSNIANATVK